MEAASDKLGQILIGQASRDNGSTGLPWLGSPVDGLGHGRVLSLLGLRQSGLGAGGFCCLSFDFLSFDFLGNPSFRGLSGCRRRSLRLFGSAFLGLGRCAQGRAFAAGGSANKANGARDDACRGACGGTRTVTGTLFSRGVPGSAALPVAFGLSTASVAISFANSAAAFGIAAVPIGIAATLAFTLAATGIAIPVSLPIPISLTIATATTGSSIGPTAAVSVRAIPIAAASVGAIALAPTTSCVSSIPIAASFSRIVASATFPGIAAITVTIPAIAIPAAIARPGTRFGMSR